jgi:hypothetical protein
MAAQMTGDRHYRMLGLSRSVLLSNDGLALPVGVLRPRLVLPIMSISGVGLTLIGYLTITIWTLDIGVVCSPAIRDLSGVGSKRSGRKIRTITKEIWSEVSAMQGEGGPLSTIATQRMPNRPMPQRRHRQAFGKVWDPESGDVDDWGVYRSGHTQGWW